MKKAIALRGID